MAEVVHVIVHVLDAAEREEAKAAIENYGDFEVTPSCVYGHIDPSRIPALQERGFLVETPPTELDKLDTSIEEDLLADSPDNDVFDPLRRSTPKVYLANAIGPLRAKWRDSLARSGMQIMNIMRPGVFTVELDDDKLDELKTKGWVKSIREYGIADTARDVRLPVKQTPAAQTIEYELVFGVAKSAPVAELAIEGSLDPALEELFLRLSADPRVHEATIESRRRLRFTTKSKELVAELERIPGVLEVTTERTYEVGWHSAVPQNTEAIAAVLRADPRAKEVEVGVRRIRFRCDARSPLLVSISKMPQIESLNLYTEPELGNVWARRVVGVEALPVVPASEGLPSVVIPWTGRGVIVGVADSGVDVRHVDLKDAVKKVLPRVPDQPAGDFVGHGTHVCGTIAGSGAGSGGAIRGIAPDAKLIVQCIADKYGALKGKPLDLGELYEEARREGVHIHTNSWGTKTDGRVSSDSMDTDRFVYDHPDFFVLFAAGNDGQWAETEAKRGTLRAPGTAKNVLTVGASCTGRTDGPYETRTQTLVVNDAEPIVERFIGDIECIPITSARGPSDDGRVKPDLLAPGTAILSTWVAEIPAAMPEPAMPSGACYAWMSGTSMATPVAAGAAACVRQYFVEGRGIQPSAALMRAALIHATSRIRRVTSQDAAVGHPNFNQGHGRLDLGVLFGKDAIGELPKVLVRDIARTHAEALYQNTALAAVVGHPGAFGATVRVKAGARRPLRVTLAWTDRPGRGLQQDLDLLIRTPTERKPRMGNPELVRMPGQPLDRTNNVENVVLENPAAGEYLIRVTAFTTPFEPQGYALMVSGDLDQDDWVME